VSNPHRRLHYCHMPYEARTHTHTCSTQHLNQYNITVDIAINYTCEGHHYKRRLIRASVDQQGARNILTLVVPG